MPHQQQQLVPQIVPRIDPRIVPPTFLMPYFPPDRDGTRSLVLPLIGGCVLICGTFGRMPAPEAGDLHCPMLRSHAPAADDATADSLVAAVNAVVPTDIQIPTAARVTCAERQLPRSRNALVSLLAEQHGKLIAECGRGRAVVKRGVHGFDLLTLLLTPLEEPPDETDDSATIRGFFDAGAVDVAVGKGLSDGAYPIGFDWVLVLDQRSHVLYSFILNCRD